MDVSCLANPVPAPGTGKLAEKPGPRGEEVPRVLTGSPCPHPSSLVGDSGPGLPCHSAETGLPEVPPVRTQSSACTLASAVSRRFSSLLQVLEKQQASTLSDIEVAKKQALGQVLDEEQRLTEHLRALSQYDHSVQDLLGQVDDYIFFQVPDIRASG